MGYPFCILFVKIAVELVAVVFTFNEGTEIYNLTLINEIKNSPHEYFVYKFGNVFNLAKISIDKNNPNYKEINHILKYGIYKDTFTLDENNRIFISNIHWIDKSQVKLKQVALELSINNEIIINSKFVKFYPLYEISNTGCNNNNFYLHYFDYNTNSFNSISFHFNIFLRNYRFHLKNFIPENETFFQSKIKIDETNKDFLVSNIIGYDPQIIRAKDSMDNYLNTNPLFYSLNNDNDTIENIFANYIIYIKILKIFQGIMFEKYDFNGIEYEFDIFDKTIKIDNNNNDGTDHEYRIIKYPDGTKYFLSTEEQPNNDYFKYLERYDK